LGGNVGGAREMTMLTRNRAMKWTDRIGRRLKLNDLHIFLTVAELGSMGKAAEQLAISQSSISKAMADMEHTVGVRLLDRNAKGVELTHYGRALLRRGIGAFDELRQGIEDIQFLDDPTVGEVRVGCPEAIASGLMARVLDLFSSQYPQAVIRIRPADNMTQEFRQLRERKVDLLLGGIPGLFQEVDLDAEVLFEDRPFIVSGNNSRWASRRKIELGELLEESWLLPGDGFLSSLLAEAFQLRGLAGPKHGVTSYSVYQRVFLLNTGRFVAVQSGSVLHFARQHFAFKVLPVDLALRSWPVAIVTLKNRTMSPLVQRLIDYVRDTARALAKDKVLSWG
jgi:DNA-binding transcriptional LysR family regulator